MGVFDWFASLFGKGKQARVKSVSDQPARYAGPTGNKGGGIDLEQLDAQKKNAGTPGPPPPNSPNSPMVDFLTMGRWLSVTSTNVAAIAFDLKKQTLYVQFHPGSKDPNPRYWYTPINAAQAGQFAVAPSKGGWVWDHLRVRGTKYGHKVPYGHM